MKKLFFIQTNSSHPVTPFIVITDHEASFSERREEEGRVSAEGRASKTPSTEEAAEEVEVWVSEKTRPSEPGESAVPTPSRKNSPDGAPHSPPPPPSPPCYPSSNLPPLAGNSARSPTSPPRLSEFNSSAALPTGGVSVKIDAASPVGETQPTLFLTPKTMTPLPPISRPDSSNSADIVDVADVTVANADTRGGAAANASSNVIATDKNQSDHREANVGREGPKAVSKLKPEGGKTAERPTTTTDREKGKSGNKPKETSVAGKKSGGGGGGSGGGGGGSGGGATTKPSFPLQDQGPVLASHPLGKGVLFKRNVFNLGGKSPLLMHVFAQQNLLDGTGVDRLVPWTKVTKWPNPKEKTYRDLIGDKTTMIDGANGRGRRERALRDHESGVGPLP